MKLIIPNATDHLPVRVFREFIDTDCYDQIIRLARNGIQQTECK